MSKKCYNTKNHCSNAKRECVVMSKSFFAADDKRVPFSGEEVSSPRQPEESQEEVEGIVKSLHFC